MLEYAQLGILTVLVENYYVGDQLEKDLLLANLEIMKKDKILAKINKCIKTTPDNFTDLNGSVTDNHN